MENISKTIMTIQIIMGHLWFFKHTEMQFKKVSIGNLGGSFHYIFTQVILSIGSQQHLKLWKWLSLSRTNLLKTCKCSLGQAHPWVVPLGMSHFDFPRPIEISIISRILCVLIFLIIAFKKRFKNVALVFFLELFG
jgi:hypothetical protein